MKGSNQYRYAEYCLYSYFLSLDKYRYLKKQLTMLRAECDVHGQNYDRSIQRGSSSPVERYVERIHATEIKLARLKRRIKPIQKLRRELRSKSQTPLMKIILEQSYFYQNTLQNIKERYRISEKKYYALRSCIVSRVIYHMEKT